MCSDILVDLSFTSNEVTAIIDYASRKLNIALIPDGEPFEAILKLARICVGALTELDAAAKQIISRDLLNLYNSGWNDYDEVQEDGSIEAVMNPALREDEFKRKFVLYAINITGDSLIQFFYNDSGLFWGHSVIVSSFSGTDFNDALAELFG